MHARILTPSTAAATSGWRQPRRRSRAAGRLDLLSNEVLGRFLDEGVPEADARKALRLAAHKLSISTRIVTRGEGF